MKTWLSSKNTRLHLSSIQKEEDNNISMMEGDRTVDMARGQRIAEANAQRSRWESKMICGKLVDDICGGISQKAVVMSWIKEMMDIAWMEVEVRQIWTVMKESQPIQKRILRMVEEQEL
jgi:hypothetical protein